MMNLDNLEQIGTMYEGFTQFKTEDVSNLVDTVNNLSETVDNQAVGIVILSTTVLVGVVTGIVCFVKHRITKKNETGA